MTTKPLIIFCSLLLTTLILSIPLLVNPALKTRTDAVIHTGIARAIMREGIPPSNPFLAGEKLSYYWFYNALTALICVTIGVNPGSIMILLNIIALLLLLLLVFKITNSFTGRNSNGFLAAEHDSYLACYTFLKSTPVDRALIKGRREQVWRLRSEEVTTEILDNIVREASHPIGLIWYSGTIPGDGPLTLLHTEGEIELWGY